MTGWPDVSLAEMDWLVLPKWKRLHAGDLTHEQSLELDDGWPQEDVKTACGKVGFAAIPGWFARQSVPRCAKCCTATGMPEGVGSPKNDDECRAILGLDPA